MPRVTGPAGVAVVLVLWVIAGPLGTALGGCTGMGTMCEGPCGVASCAVWAPESAVAMPLVETMPPDRFDGAPTPVLTVLDPPPKPLLAA